MFRHRMFVLIGLAAFFAVAAGLMANKWLAAQQDVKDAISDNLDTVKVVVAALDVAYGNVIESDHLKVIDVPAELMPQGGFNEYDDMVGKIAKRDFVAGEMILSNYIASPNDSSVLSALLEPNMRAVTVRANDVVSVAGFLLPGNRVDVLSTVSVDRSNFKSSTILQNIKVLAVDQRASKDDNAPKVGRSVTLEVTPEQAETLVKAQIEGSIQLTLRNPMDTEIKEAPKVVAKPKKRVIRKAPEPEITLIRGTQSENARVTFRE